MECSLFLPIQPPLSMCFFLRLSRRVGLTSWLMLACAVSLHAQLPPNFQQQTLISGLNQPLDMAFLPDDRALILQQDGHLLVTNNPQPEVPPVATSTFMTLPNVIADQERGSTNLLLDPDFATNGYFYLYYAHSVANKFRLSRFQDLGSPAARLASEFLLWEDVDPIAGCCHFGGAMEFLPDGTLLLTIGDKFQVGQSQDLTRMGGKILRLDPSGYLVYPPDNPFYDGTPGRYNANGELQAVWAYGLRNPFSAYMDTVLDRFYIAEVGGNVSAQGFEDIHVGVMGANYGWPDCGDGKNLPSNGRDANGNCLDPSFEDPIFAYPHNNTPSCIMMGYLNRSTHFPTATYQNALFYSDHRRNYIRYLSLDNTGQVLGDFDFMPTGAIKVVGLWEGPDGSMYWLRYNTNNNGFLYRIYWNGTLAPVINAATVSYPGPAFTANLDAQFTDVDGDALTYEWFYGDGTSSGPLPLPAGGSPYTLPTQAHVYPSNGQYDAYLQIQGTNHVINSDPVTVIFGAPPVAVIDLPGYPGQFQAGMTLTFSGANSLDPDGVLTGANMTWTIEFNNAGTLQPRYGPTTGLGGTFTVPVNNHLDFSGGKTYVITLTIIDADGLTTTVTQEIFPEIVNLTFVSIPPGLPILIDDQPRGTPFVLDNVVGFQHEIEMASPTCKDGIRYEFGSWSQGGPNVQTVVIPATDATLTATMIVTGDDNFLDLDGLDDRVTLPALALAGPFTLEAWVRPDTAGPASNVVMGDPTTYALSLAGGVVRLRAQDGSPGTGYADPDDKVVGTTLLADSTWTHVAVTRDAAGQLTVYVDGQPDGTAGTWLGTFTLSRLGQGPAGFLAGGLDEVRVWGVARSATEIAAYFDHTVPVNSPDLLAYYRMDDPGQVVPDRTLNGYDGTLGATNATAADDPARNSTDNPPLDQGPCEATVLPTGLLTFAAEAVPGGVLTRWAVDREEAGVIYEVQQLDRHYRTLGQVRGEPGRDSYHWLDRQAAPGTHTYRLRLIHPNGRSTFSEPRTVQVTEGHFGAALFPNPARETVSLRLQPGTWDFRLWDALGREVLHRAGHQDQASLHSLNVSALPAGIYTYRLFDGAGTQSGKLSLAR